MSKKLYIICGHGDGDTGAIGCGYTEAERVRALALRIKYYGGDNVILADQKLHGAKSNLLGNKQVPQDVLVLELHLDSFHNSSARGGHVIIWDKFEPDKYDLALERCVSKRFAGRSKTIVGRSDLVNLKRAAQNGYNYRLLECCFISNEKDMQIFNNNIDSFAKEILNCFDIETDNPIKTFVKVSVEQLKLGCKGEAVKTLQILLVANGYGRFNPDSSFGILTNNAVKEYQSKNNLTVNGIVDSAMWFKLLGGCK